MIEWLIVAGAVVVYGFAHDFVVKRRNKRMGKWTSKDMR